MGWPKKNEDYRLYYVRKDKTYLLVRTAEELSTRPDAIECLGELMQHNDPNNPKLASGSACDAYIRNNCRRVSWNDLPDVWKQAFLDRWFNHEPVEDPRNCRGLWRTEEDPYAHE